MHGSPRHIPKGCPYVFYLDMWLLFIIMMIRRHYRQGLKFAP